MCVRVCVYEQCVCLCMSGVCVVCVRAQCVSGVCVCCV